MGFLAPIAGAAAGAASSAGSAIGSIGGILGSLVSAAGAIMGGQAQARQFKYQQQVAEMNSRIAQDNANRARDAAQVNQLSQDQQATAFLGEQLAAQAGSNVDIGSRSALGARKAARAVARQDALNVIQAGELRAHNSLVDKANFDAQGAQAGMAANNAQLQGFLGAATSLIGATRGFGRNSSRITGAPVPRNRPMLV